jgi:hypothetical protein
VRAIATVELRDLAVQQGYDCGRCAETLRQREVAGIGKPLDLVVIR